MLSIFVLLDELRLLAFGYFDATESPRKLTRLESQAMKDETTARVLNIFIPAKSWPYKEIDIMGELLALCSQWIRTTRKKVRQTYRVRCPKFNRVDYFYAK